jgi:hypothetical protein
VGAGNVVDLVKNVSLFTKKYGFNRLSIVDHGAQIVNDANEIVGFGMYVGKDFLTGSNISKFSKELAKLDDALTADALVKIVNCFVAADPLLHKGLAKAIGRPVIAGVGITSAYCVTNDGGFFRCDPDGNVTPAGKVVF